MDRSRDRVTYTLTATPVGSGTVSGGSWAPPAETEPTDPYTFTAHLKLLSGGEKEALGYDPTEGMIEILCKAPKEGSAQITAGASFTFTPSFEGKAGVLTIQSRPEGRLKPALQANGKKYVAKWEMG